MILTALHKMVSTEMKDWLNLPEKDPRKFIQSAFNITDDIPCNDGGAAEKQMILTMAVNLEKDWRLVPNQLS